MSLWMRRRRPSRVKNSRAWRPVEATERGMRSSSSIICSGLISEREGGWAHVGGGRGGQRAGAGRSAAPAPLPAPPSTQTLPTPAAANQQPTCPPRLCQVVLVSAPVPPRLWLEQKVACDQLKHHASQRPDVGRGVVRGAHDDLVMTQAAGVGWVGGRGGVRWVGGGCRWGGCMWMR